jgi:hypothetical protein
MMLLVVALLWLSHSLLRPVEAMRSDYLAQLRQDTVDMFYHGYSNYMKHAFPEDEVGFFCVIYGVRQINTRR